MDSELEYGVGGWHVCERIRAAVMGKELITLQMGAIKAAMSAVVKESTIVCLVDVADSALGWMNVCLSGNSCYIFPSPLYQADHLLHICVCLFYLSLSGHRRRAIKVQ